MDVYHQVLVKLYEETGGRESKQVDFEALLKKMGFFSNYPDIAMRLNREGWITDGPTTNYVFITHWGAMEAKKSLKGDSGNSKDAAAIEVKRSVSVSKEVSILLENLAENMSKENLESVQGKLEELNKLLGQIKANL